MGNECCLPECASMTPGTSWWWAENDSYNQGGGDLPTWDVPSYPLFCHGSCWHSWLIVQGIFVGKICKIKHLLWEKDQKELKQQLNTINCSVNGRVHKVWFPKDLYPLHRHLFFFSLLWSLAACKAGDSLQFELFNYNNFELFMGSTAHVLSGQPEGQTEQIKAIAYKRKNFRFSFLYPIIVLHKTCHYFVSLIFSCQSW